MRLNKSLFIVLSLGLLVVLSSIFTVQQSQQAIIQRLGKFLIDPDGATAKLYAPGLHFKIPLVDTVHFLDQRLNILNINKSRIVTIEKKDVIVDLFVQWRIKNFDLFFKANNRGRISIAERLLFQKTIDGLSAEFGKRTIKEVVSGERLQLMRKLQDDINKSAAPQGIEVMDVRIKRIDLPDEVSSAVYSRMRTERESAARRFRADGASQAEIIRSTADKEARIELATAKKKAAYLKGSGDATAVKIYASSYKRNPEFFEFVRSLEAYRNSFHTKKDVLILKPEGDFFKYFTQAIPSKSKSSKQ